MCLFKCISRPEKERHVYGFTIVELIIVIVVIGILASISIVAYNGIQDRARNAKRLSAVQTYVKVLEAYRVHNRGAMPPAPDVPSSVGAVCIGSPSMYPAKDGFDAGECFKMNGMSVFVNETFNRALIKDMGGSAPPDASYPVTTMNGDQFGVVRQRGVIAMTRVSSSNSSTVGYIVPANPPIIGSTQDNISNAAEFYAKLDGLCPGLRGAPFDYAYSQNDSVVTVKSVFCTDKYDP